MLQAVEWLAPRNIVGKAGVRTQRTWEHIYGRRQDGPRSGPMKRHLGGKKGRAGGEVSPCFRSFERLLGRSRGNSRT